MVDITSELSNKLFDLMHEGLAEFRKKVVALVGEELFQELVDDNARGFEDTFKMVVLGIV